MARFSGVGRYRIRIPIDAFSLNGFGPKANLHDIRAVIFGRSVNRIIELLH